MSFIKHNGIYLLLLILLIIIYWTPMLSPQTIWIDDDWMLQSIRKFHNLQDYIAAYFRYETLDRQPVRDLSLFVDDIISEKIGFPIFRISNLLIWVCCLFVFQRILTMWNWSQLTMQIALLYVGTHPVSVNSVAMLSSRKHLLAVLFILLALYFFSNLLRSHQLSNQQPHRQSQNKSQAIGFVIAYLLSCLSQPIYVLVPIGFYALLLKKNSNQSWDEKINEMKIFLIRHRSLALLTLLIAVVISLDNYFYYSSDYFSKLSGYNKFHADQEWLRRILVYGRSVYQMIVVDAPSILPYHLGGVRSYIGLIFILAIAILMRIGMIKNKIYQEFDSSNFKTPISLALLFFLPLIVVTAKMTEQGGWDTYLLFSLFCWTVFVFQYVTVLMQAQSGGRFNSYRKYSITAIIFAVICMNFIVSVTHAQYFISTESVLKRMSDLEHSNLYRMMYAQKRINNHPEEIDLIYKEALEVYQSNPKTANLGYVLGRSLLNTNLLNDLEKKTVFDKFSVESLWWFYWKAVYFAKKSQYDKANEIMISGWEQLKSHDDVDADSLIEIKKNWLKMCEVSGSARCREVIKSK